MNAAKSPFPARPVAAPPARPAAPHMPVDSAVTTPRSKAAVAAPVPAPSPAPSPKPAAGAAPATVPPGIETGVTLAATTPVSRPAPKASPAPEDAATVIDPPREERTLLATGGPSPAVSSLPSGASKAPGETVAGARTTILPRVQLVGDRPELIQDRRRRFEVLRTLGEGGAGEVLAAADNDIGRQVALKKIRGEVMSPEALVRFVEEIRIIGRLEHPNIIPIHDVGIDERGDYYFVMKLVDGETIESLIEKLRRGDRETHRLYPFERRVQIFRGLLEAVAFAHARGIVHRDIKPANVMVGRFGEVLLMDWGIAKPIREEGPSIDDAVREQPAGTCSESSHALRTQLGALIGTPLYMSPEQACGEPVDERSDVYSLAALLYEFLFLRHYLDGCRTLDEVLAGVKERPISVRGAPDAPGQPTVPMDLRWYVKRGLEKDPDRRYPSAQAMIDRLDRRAEGDIPIQCPITFAKRTSTALTRIIDRHPFAFLLGTVAVLGSAATLGVLQFV
ncbi:MAG: serine/threonine protein kinase [Deltaproteobacteria bacterium]|nr:serine/threonine protein kinase [Deltaproteobacteria bacterium]